MGLCDGPSPAPGLCPADAYDFLVMGVVAMLVSEPGGQEDCSYGLSARGCATWWAHPWGKPSEGMEPVWTDSEVFCFLHGLV